MILISDIGGTNARFALLDDDQQLLHMSRLRCADYATLSHAVDAYLKAVGQPMPQQAVVAIAAPVIDDWVDMTNHNWLLSVDEIREELGLSRLKVINDFAAMALCVPSLTSRELRQIGRGFKADDSAMAVLGPGTGLGMSGLIRAGDLWMPLQGEGGHIPFCGPTDADLRVIELIRNRKKLISAETIVSGPGLALLYESIAEVRGFHVEPLTPPQVGQRAIEAHDAIAVEAARYFSAALGTVASSLALILGARGGVYIGGGVVSYLGSAFDESLFRAQFEKCSEFQPYLSDVPTYVIDAKYPALRGAMLATRAEYDHLGVTSMA